MRELLDDPQDQQQQAEQLGLVRVVCLAFLGKWMVELFVRLQVDPPSWMYYALWLMPVIQLATVQRALYAFYAQRERKLMRYLRWYYLSIGVYFIVIAILVTNMVWADHSYFNLVYSLVWWCLEASLALLLARYFFNLLESPQYWLCMEDLILLSVGVLIVNRVWLVLQNNFFINELGIQLINWGFYVLMPLLIIGRCLLSIHKVNPSNQWLLLFSTLALLCWQMGMHARHAFLVDRDVLLFAAVVLAVFAFASSFNGSVVPPKE